LRLSSLSPPPAPIPRPPHPSSIAGAMEPRTPTPSAADKDNKEQMRAVIAAAEAALGVGDGASTSAVAQAESSSPASAPPSDEYYRGFMAFQSMQHHAEVARRQAQHASDLPPSPEPSTLPFPSFLSQPLTAPTAGTSAAAAPAATVGEHQSSTGAPPSSAAGADPVETEHPCELAPVATARSTTPQANARTVLRRLARGWPDLSSTPGLGAGPSRPRRRVPRLPSGGARPRLVAGLRACRRSPPCRGWLGLLLQRRVRRRGGRLRHHQQCVPQKNLARPRTCMRPMRRL